MRIGINGYYLSVPYAGIGQYTYNLLSSLAEIDKKNKYIIFTYYDTDVVFGKNFKIVKVPMVFQGNFFGRYIWEQYQLSRAIKEHDINIYHSPYQTLPLISKKVPSIVTIHDAIPWRFPFQRKQLSYRLYSDLSRTSCKRAQKYITVSETTKVDFAPIYEIKPELIEVTYESIHKVFNKNFSAKEVKDFRERFNINRKYIIYVGGLKRHKNIRILIKAFSKFKQYYDKKNEYDLFLLGDIRKNMAISPYIYYRVEDLEKYSSLKKVRKHIRFYGKQSFNDLALFYKEASLFISLSLYEGFGLPALEAITVKTPSILSNLGAFQEIIKDGALYVYPYGSHRVARKIADVLFDKNFQKNLINKGVEVAKEYDRLKIANRVLEIYEEVHDDYKFRDSF